MKLLNDLRQSLLPPALQRECAIRLRLLRSSLSLESIRAERRADVLLISYPKCGRTWLTLLLSHALAAHAGIRDFDPLATDLLDRQADGHADGQAPNLPRVRISHDDNPQWKTPRGLAQTKRRYRDKRVILLVRDPRDVVVSMYFERTRRERAYDGSLREFLHEPRGSLATILAYYNVWARECRQPRGFCLVRYEDLQADTAGELTRILGFIGLPRVNAAHVRAAATFASFDSMRSMELGDALHSGRLRARDPRDPESYKTRRGKVGGYRDYLPPTELAWLEREIQAGLDASYGYLSPARVVQHATQSEEVLP